MKLRTRLNLVVAGLTAAFVIVLIAAEIQSTRTSVREEIEAANRVASQLLGRLASSIPRSGGPELVLQFLQQLGHVRANDIILLSRRPARCCTARRRRPTRRAARRRPGLRICWRRTCHDIPSRCPAACSWSSRRSRRAPCSMPGTTSPVSRAIARRHVGRRERARLLVGRARARTLSRHRRRARAHPAGRPGLPSAAAARATRRSAIGAAFNRMAQAVRTRCRPSARRTKPRRGSKSGAKWPRSSSSASRRSGA